MIDNFTAQPYPLECSADGTVWALVIGWQKLGDGRLTPVVAPSDTPLGAVADPTELRYRVAGAHPVAPSRPAKAPTRS